MLESDSSPSCGFNQGETAALKQIEALARLSQIFLSSTEKESFARQVPQILTAMNELQSIDTQGVEPLYSPAEGFRERSLSGLREDQVGNENFREAILQSTSQVEDSCFVVPQVVKKAGR